MVTKITQNEETVTLTIELDKQTAKRLRFDETTPHATLRDDGLFLTTNSSNNGSSVVDRCATIARTLGDLDEKWGPVFKKLAE